MRNSLEGYRELEVRNLHAKRYKIPETPIERGGVLYTPPLSIGILFFC
jgi:hypothetical protein